MAGPRRTLGARGGAGDELSIDGRAFRVARVITFDGTKIVLDHGWWFGVRPSGTEPVVRPYVETFAPAGASPGAAEALRAEAEAWQRRIMAWPRTRSPR